MYIPDEPPIGNLVAYEYLWLSQENTREDGPKAYPVALIFAKKIIASVILAYAVGMSHKPPDASEKAIEVPRKLKRHLGLDGIPPGFTPISERSLDERSDIRGGARVVPDVAPLIRATCLGMGRRTEKCHDMAQHEVNSLLRIAAH